MYEWLEHEIAAVKTPKFFIVSDQSENQSGDEMDIHSFPNSYTGFLRKFGKSKFFRDSTDCYEIGVYANPEEKFIDGERYWEVGWYDESGINLKEAAGAENGEWPVYEQSKFGRMRKVSESFEDWLHMRWEDTKAGYSTRKWNTILKGPDPFTPEELKIVEARRKFRWRLLEIDEDSTMRFEVTNGSDRRLPYIGVGIHGTRRDVWLAIVLRVDHILPGTSAVVEYDGFRPDSVLALDPDEIEVFERPEPGPWDRGLYSEFRSLPDEPNAESTRQI